jgi:DNA-binding NarL/FixJ family response regulator
MDDVICTEIEAPEHLSKAATAGEQTAGTKSHHKAGSIALVESRTFVRECMHRGLQAALALPVVTFSSLMELESQFNESLSIILLSLADNNETECASALKLLSELAPKVPIAVLSTLSDTDFARTAVNFGAKGYIPCTTSFEIAVEAVRFILAGGTYVPIGYLFGAGAPAPAPSNHSKPSESSLSSLLTPREISIVHAIQEGMSNKVIAYKLCICEGTVKVHLRNIMKKMKARNRTEVAIKLQTSMPPFRKPNLQVERSLS